MPRVTSKLSSSCPTNPNEESLTSPLRPSFGEINSATRIPNRPTSSSISTIILPIAEPSQDPIDTYNVLSFEEELTRLELETSDDLVYNTLGSFPLNPTSVETAFEPYIQNVDIIGPRGQYTVRSAKVRDSADYHRHVRRRRETIDEGTVTGAGSAKTTHVRDSGISSANTPEYPASPSVLVFEQQSYDIESKNGPKHDDREEFELNRIVSLKESDNEMDVEPDLNEIGMVRPVKLQVNGSIGGPEVPDPSGGGGRAGTSSRRHHNTKQRLLRSEPSLHGRYTDRNPL